MSGLFSAEFEYVPPTYGMKHASMKDTTVVNFRFR